MATVALSVGLVPATALATVGDSGVYYKLPTKPMSVTQKWDSGVEYEELSVSATAPPMLAPAYFLLGCNNVGFGGLPTADQVTDGTITSFSGTSARASLGIGLFGSEANVNPDPYLWNYACYINGATGIADTEMCNTNVSSRNVTVGGTEFANMPYEIFMECQILRGAANGDVKSGDYTYTEWINYEKKRDGSRLGEKYNPEIVGVAPASGGAAAVTAGLYKMAETMDGLIEKSKVGNDYKLATRYAVGPETYKVVQDYEDIVKASQYYIISQIAAGKYEKRVAAALCGYDPDTHLYACRVFNTDKDPNGNQYGGRLANCLAQIATSITDLGLEEQQPVQREAEEGYVKWYSPEQIVTNCDAVFASDAAAHNNVSTYLATSSDGVGHQLYVTDANGTDTFNPVNMQDLLDAQAKAKQDGAQKVADICYKFPATIFGVYYAQGSEIPFMSVICGAFLYPESFDLTDMMAWWSKHIWHITDASLQDIVDSTCYGISLSTNQSQISKIAEGFEARVDNKLAVGNYYYLKHKDEIDAINGGNIKTYDPEALKARNAATDTETLMLGLSANSTDDEIALAQSAYDALSADEQGAISPFAKPLLDAVNAAKTASSAATAAEQRAQAAEIAKAAAESAAKPADQGVAKSLAKSKVNKLKPGKKKLAVKFSKVKNASLYIVQYKVKGAKKWSKAYTTSTSTTLKNLKKGKKYQVCVVAMASGYNNSVSATKASGKIK